MEFDWSTRSISSWQSYLGKAPRANYLQSVPFAKAVHKNDQKVTRLALIQKNGEAIGMAAFQEIKLGPIHVIYLYRGPLWFTQNPPEAWLGEFAELFNRTFPKRFLRRRRWLPEWRITKAAKTTLEEQGFRTELQSYETVWLDLTKSEEQLRKKLKQKWRNALNEGERCDIRIQQDWTGGTLNLFLRRYEQDKRAKGYSGRSAKFIRDEIRSALPLKDVFVVWALKDDDVLAAIMILIHGKSASYRIGWTTKSGRAVNAHNVLLWEAVKILKNSDVDFFDLGGVEPTNTGGLTKFKDGMGGEKYPTLGLCT